MNMSENTQISDKAFIDLLPSHLASRAQADPRCLRAFRRIYDDFGVDATRAKAAERQRAYIMDRYSWLLGLSLQQIQDMQENAASASRNQMHDQQASGSEGHQQ